MALSKPCFLKALQALPATHNSVLTPSNFPAFALSAHSCSGHFATHDGIHGIVSWTASSSWVAGTSFFRTGIPNFRGNSRSLQFSKESSKSIRATADAGNNSGAVTLTSQGKVYLPLSDFYKVEAIVRPWRVSHVAAALIKMGIRGVTVSDVRGFGAQGGSRERQAGSEFSEDNFVLKVKLEVVVSADQRTMLYTMGVAGGAGSSFTSRVEDVIDTVIDQAKTGEIGDGKIFVVPVSDVIRVRTGERGLRAERMVGGRADILSLSPDGDTNGV